MDKDCLIFLKLKGLDIDLVKSSVSQDKDGNIVAYIYLNDHNVPCPNCGAYDCVIKDYQKRKITHSISTDTPSIIYYKARRYKCKGCGCIFYESNPFVQRSKKISTYTDLLILDKLKNQNTTFSSVAKDLFISTTSVVNTFDKYIQENKFPYGEAISIDEIYTKNLTHKKYCCVVFNFVHRQIIDIFPSRIKYDLINNFMRVPQNTRNQVKYVVIDMWDTYKQVAHSVFPNCVVAVDSFHVMEHLNKAVDDIRLKVMRKYDKGHSRLVEAEIYYYMLKKFAEMLIGDIEKFPNYIKIHKYNYTWPREAILHYLLSIDDDLKEAYELKEKYREFNLTAEYDTCDEELDDLINEFKSSRIDELREFGNMIYHWRDEIKNSFLKVNCRFYNKTTHEFYWSYRRISNGPIEGVNSRIKGLIKNANGFRDFDRFKRRVLYVINRNYHIKN